MSGKPSRSMGRFCSSATPTAGGHHPGGRPPGCRRAWDLPADEALVMAVTQKAPVGSTFGDAVSDPAWKKKPTWYQVSTSDRMIHPDTERRLAERMNPQSTIELDASHASLASKPSAVAALIDQAATALT